MPDTILPMTGAQLEEAITQGGLEVVLSSPVTLNGVQNVWESPDTNIFPTGDLQSLFDYVGGSIVYTGSQPMKFKFVGTQTITSLSGNELTIEFALGKNGSVDTRSTQQTQSKQSGLPKEISCQKVFDLANGDSLDFFIRQTSSVSDESIQMVKGLWIVTKTMILV